MELPIDARKAPFKPKYIDEETYMLERWMIFGRHDDGTVDVASRSGDVFTHVTREQATRLIEVRDRFCDAILATLNGDYP